jgi:hypothetical protein
LKDDERLREKEEERERENDMRREREKWKRWIEWRKIERRGEMSPVSVLFPPRPSRFTIMS